MARRGRTSGRPGVIGYFARHRTAANLLLVVLLVAGIWAAPQMRAQFFPDSINEEVTVSVSWSGAGPEDMDRAVVQLLEPALLAVEGVASSEAVAREGNARITLEFEAGWDITKAEADVQRAVDAVSNLPEGADDPNVRRDEWRDRVTDVVITGPVGVDQLARFADEFVTRLFQEGITRTTIQGVAAPSILVEVPSVKLIQHDVTMREIADAIAAAADTSPAGDVAGANARVRTGVPSRTAAEVRAVAIRSDADGTTLTVGDVAQVYSEGVDRARAYFVGENPAIAVRVDRSAMGDSIRMQAAVQKVAAEMTLALPEGTRIDLIRTRAEAITNRLDILVRNGLMGLAIVVTLLFLFLSARTAFWVAAGIPVAMSAAIFFMFAFGMTLNMVSLFALIITLGIVVDDAIVVGEHADWRVRHLRETPEQAAVNGAYRMAPPVFASTVTTVIAFAGLLTISGNFGRLIGDIPIVVILVLIASLVECFLILPSHMLHALAGSGGKLRWYDVPSHYVNIGFSWVRETLFRPFMAGVLWARYPVLAGAVLLLALQGASFVRGDVQWRFWNSPEQGSVSGNFAMLPGATRSDTMEMMREMQRAADAVAARLEAEHGTNPLVYVVAEVGGNTGRVLAGSETKDENQLGSISIELIDADLRPYSSFEFVAQLQEEVRNHPMVEEVSFRGWRGGPGGDALSVRFSGVDAETLKSASEALKTALSAFPEVSAVEDNMAYDKEELVLDLTPRGEALGFSIDAVGRILRERLGGIEAANFPDGPRTATIRVELPSGELTADFLERTQMRSATGQYVPLADIVSVERVAGFSSVRREDGMRLISVTGDIASDDPERANEIGLALRQTILPQIEEDFGVAWELSGLAEDERSFLGDAAVGFGLCLLGIYLALAWIFSSWGRPFVVMAVIPFGLVGAIWGHAVWDVPISMFSVVGLIGMAGIIVNDSIVLVSTVDEYRNKRGLIPAIIDGACDRLRPVFLTTLTTVLGLAPLLFERSQDAQFLRPTVITIVYGLGFGMVLVLLVVPALLAIGQDFANQGRSLRRAVASRSRDRGLGAVALVGAAGVLALFAATVGAQVWTGALPAVFGGLAGAGFGGAVVAFLGAVAVFLVALAAVAAALLGRRRAA